MREYQKIISASGTKYSMKMITDSIAFAAATLLQCLHGVQTSSTMSVVKHAYRITYVGQATQIVHKTGTYAVRLSFATKNCTVLIKIVFSVQRRATDFLQHNETLKLFCNKCV